MSNLSQDNLNDVLKHFKSMTPEQLAEFQRQTKRITKQFDQYNPIFKNPMLKDIVKDLNKSYNSPLNKRFREIKNMMDTPEHKQLLDVAKKFKSLDKYKLINFMNTGFPNAIASTEAKYPNTNKLQKNQKYNNNESVNKVSHPHVVKQNEKFTNNGDINESLLSKDDTNILKKFFYSVLLELCITCTADEFKYFIKMLLKALSQL